MDISGSSSRETFSFRAIHLLPPPHEGATLAQTFDLIDYRIPCGVALHNSWVNIVSKTTETRNRFWSRWKQICVNGFQPQVTQSCLAPLSFLILALAFLPLAFSSWAPGWMQPIQENMGLIFARSERMNGRQAGTHVKAANRPWRLPSEFRGMCPEMREWDPDFLDFTLSCSQILSWLLLAPLHCLPPQSRPDSTPYYLLLKSQPWPAGMSRGLGKTSVSTNQGSGRFYPQNSWIPFPEATLPPPPPFLTLLTPPQATGLE